MALSIEPLLQLRSLGQRLRIARKRRGWTIAETTARARISCATLNAVELGKASVSISSLTFALLALGLHATLAGVARPDVDFHGKALEAARRSGRIRKAKRTEFDLLAATNGDGASGLRNGAGVKTGNRAVRSSQKASRAESRKNPQAAVRPSSRRVRRRSECLSPSA